MRSILLIIVAGVITLSSCKKDEKKCDVTTANIAGSYKASSAKYKASSSSAEIDGLSLLFLEDCTKDDLFGFNANGTFTITDAGIMCDPAGNDSSNWSLNGNTITVDGTPATVSSFDCTNMVVVLDGLYNSGDKMTITYTKQ